MFESLFPRCCKCGISSTKKNVGKFGKDFYCGECYESLILAKPQEAPAKRNPNISGWNELVTPKTFNDYIGQEVIKRELRTMLDATKKHGIPVQHVLFSGGFGLGKTTIAKIFANSIDVNGIITAVNIKGSNFPKTPVVIVDEVHTIPDEEMLLGIMDKSEQIILATTTQAGSLSGPLRSRFVSLVLQPYNVTELEKMVIGAASNLKYKCPKYVAEGVAIRGKTVARTALFLFKRVYDRIILSGAITPASLTQWFTEMGIDTDGLDNADRAYLSCLSDKPIGLQHISAMTGLDKITLEETVEPYLLTKGFVKRTARGRMKGDKKPLEIW